MEKKVYEQCAIMKTAFQNFVPTISTLKMRHVLEYQSKQNRNRRKQNKSIEATYNNSRNRHRSNLSNSIVHVKRFVVVKKSEITFYDA